MLQLDEAVFRTELIPMHAMTSLESGRLLKGYVDELDEDDIMEHAHMRASKKWTESQSCFYCSGAVSVVCKLVLFTVSIASIQALQGSMPFFELTLFRYLVQIILVFLWFLGTQSIPGIEKRLAIYVFFACIFSSAYNISFSVAATYLPIGTLGAVFRTVCLIFGAFFSHFVINEKVGRIHIFAMLLHIIGAVFLLQPDFIFSSMPPDTQFSVHGFTLGPCLEEPLFSGNSSNLTEISMEMERRGVQNQILGLILLFTAAFTLSVYQALTKSKLGEVSPSALSLWNAISGTVVSMVLMVCVETPVFPGQVQCILYVIGYAVGMAGACVALTCSIR